MAVTRQKSSQVAAHTQNPPQANPIGEQGARVRGSIGNFAQSGAGDADSIAELIKLPGGRVVLYDLLVKFSAFGASRTLDLGLAQHADPDGNVVAEDPIAIAENIDVSSAGSSLQSPDLVINSRNGVTLIARCQGGTIPDAATLDTRAQFGQD